MNALILSLAMTGAEAAPERAPDPWTFEEVVARHDQEVARLEQVNRDLLQSIARWKQWSDADDRKIARLDEERRDMIEHIHLLKRSREKLMDAVRSLGVTSGRGDEVEEFEKRLRQRDRK